MKAININGSIKTYIILPKNHRDLTEQELLNLGYKDYIKPSYNKETQYLTEIVLDSINNVYTHNIIDYTQEELSINLENYKNISLNQVDSLTDEFIKLVVGERTNEYEIAEQQAREYKSAGYPIDSIPIAISTDATANNRTPQEACDDIIAMADQWRQLQMQLRAFRLDAKAKIRASVSKEEVINYLNEFEVKIIQLKQLI